MARTKTKKPELPVIASREHAETVVSEIANIMLNERIMKAKMDADIATIKERYEAEFANIANSKAERTGMLMAWAEANPEAFAGSKSIKMTMGAIGWRTGMPQLKTLSGFTWDRVLERLEQLGKSDLVRTVKEVDKATILTRREELGVAGLSALGCRVVQDETFYVEPDFTETEKRVLAAA